MLGAAPMEGDRLGRGHLRPVGQDAQILGGQPRLGERRRHVGGRERVDGQAGHVLPLVLEPYQGAEQRRARIVDERRGAGQHVGVPGEHVRHDAGEEPALDGVGVRLDDRGRLRLVVVVEPQRADARLLLAGGRDLVHQIMRTDDTDEDCHPRLLSLITVKTAIVTCEVLSEVPVHGRGRGPHARRRRGGRGGAGDPFRHAQLRLGDRGARARTRDRGAVWRAPRGRVQLRHRCPPSRGRGRGAGPWRRDHHDADHGLRDCGPHLGAERRSCLRRCRSLRRQSRS